MPYLLKSLHELQMYKLNSFRFVRYCLLMIGLMSLWSAVVAVESASPRQLTFGVYTHIRSTEMHRRMAPMQSYLQEALMERGVRAKVQLKIFPSYNRAIDALVQGQVDFVRYGPASYVLAKERNPNIRLLAIEDNDGSKGLYGVISVPVDSPIQSIEDLRGKRIAFGNRRSSTGRYMSQAALLSKGIGAKDLAGYSYLGRHDKVAFAVAAGNYDAGATNENTFNKYAESKGLRKIYQFPSINRPWVVREGLDQQVFDALQDALLQLADPAVLKTIKRSGLLPTVEADYDTIRDAIKNAGSFDPTSLTLGVYAWLKPSDIYNLMEPLMRLLKRELTAAGQSSDLRLRVFSDYQQAIDALKWGDVDFMRLGPASCIQAKADNPGIRLLVSEKSSGTPPAGVFVVAADSEISDIKQLAGKRIAFVDSFSTEGSFLAKAELLNAGLHSSELDDHAYLGRHDRVAYAVSKGVYDAGALLESVFRNYSGKLPLRAIRRFESFHKLWVVRSGLEQELYDDLRQGLLDIPASGELAEFGIDGFVSIANADAHCTVLRGKMEKAMEFDSP